MCNEGLGFSLYTQAINITLGFASSAASYFAMYLPSGLEYNPYAFLVTAVLIVLASLLILVICIYKFREIKYSGPSREYPLLKDIIRCN